MPIGWVPSAWFNVPSRLRTTHQGRPHLGQFCWEPWATGMGRVSDAWQLEGKSAGKAISIYTVVANSVIFRYSDRRKLPSVAQG